MKPWGSQVTFLAFQTFFRPHTPSPPVEGCAGEKRSYVPPDAGDVRWAPFDPPTPSGCTRLFGFRPRAAGRPGHPDTPRRPFVQAVLREGRPSRGQTKLRADATGPCRFRHLGAVPTPSLAAAGFPGSSDDPAPPG